MPQVFPKIMSDRVDFKYPITRGNRIRTKVVRFCDQTEQRWVEGVELMEMELTYRAIDPTSKDTIRTFYIQVQGQLDSTWTIVFSGVTYIDCYFTQPVFEATQTSKILWDVTIRFRGRPQP